MIAVQLVRYLISAYLALCHEIVNRALALVKRKFRLEQASILPGTSEMGLIRDLSPPSSVMHVHLLKLQESGAPDLPHAYVYLPAPTSPSYLLRFEIDGAASICQGGRLWTNIPEPGQPFMRDRYRPFSLKAKFGEMRSIDVPITLAGAFAYYITYDKLQGDMKGEHETKLHCRSMLYYIDVAPALTLQGRPVQLDALSICSVVSRFMADYPTTWHRHFQSIAYREYNAVHFAPLVTRGESDSPYSLYDQLQFDPKVFMKGEVDVAEMVHKMETQHNLLSLTDVVWNHTASNSAWLQQHPEAGYNLETAPWLEAALELDDALLKFGADLAKYDLPAELHNHDDLDHLIEAIDQHVIRPLKLWQYYAIDVEQNIKLAIEAWKAGSIKHDHPFIGVGSWSIVKQISALRDHAVINRDRLGPRFARRLLLQESASMLHEVFGAYHDDKTANARLMLTTLLNAINVSFYAQYDEDVDVILQQLSDRVRYLRLDENGPKLGPISTTSPLIETYFARLPENDGGTQVTMRNRALVCNGWIWAANALEDHASYTSRAYLRREVIVWSDCVKLRYGDSPSDNPFLWDYMTKYTQLMARHFVGFRIDNCHSTPLHVAEYLLDQARVVRPNLAVFAELFTGSEETDYEFMKRLGISALIREAMQSWTTQEMSRLVHMHGGKPIGSLQADTQECMNRNVNLNTDSQIHGPNKDDAASNVIVKKLKETPVHALFMDCTHDNEMPTQKRDGRDTLPNAALVCMCASATGSVIGYDEIYPKGVDIVLDHRQYFSDSAESEHGITRIKKLLNNLHTQMGQEGFSETFIDHQGAYISVHRQHPDTRKGYLLVAHTAYPGNSTDNQPFRDIQLEGSAVKTIGCWQLEVDDSVDVIESIKQDPKYLRGLPSKVKTLEHAKLEAGADKYTIIMPEKFPPGSIALFETSIPSISSANISDEIFTSQAQDAVSQLDLIDLNLALFRCDTEERDTSNGEDGNYVVPDLGSMVYAGLQGWWSVLEPVIRDNALGHPICNHLRQGLWALDHIVVRLRRIAIRDGRPKLLVLALWLEIRFKLIRTLPSYLVPRYFALVLQAVHAAARHRSLTLCSREISVASGFWQDLALTGVQMTGKVSSASLSPFEKVPCLAAGLPHFSTSWARCWGRDIFIALRGLYLATGRYDEAKEHIKAFASVLKHGLIPNLLGDGRSPRYNARDAIWFFLQSVQDYVTMAPRGLEILSEVVDRRFLPYDDTYFEADDSRAYSTKSRMDEIIQEAVQRHAIGLSFTEANAGTKLDMQMKSEGFHIEVHVDWGNGFIFGGNQFNCGTWMDKMGESEKAGSKGIPGTPRDGAAIELTGLLYSTLTWLHSLFVQGHYKYDRVNLPDSGSISFQAWAQKIHDNFERCYYIPQDSALDCQHDINSSIVNRRGIYKDLYRSGKEYEDYQLRANFPIAMVVAPNLFRPEQAIGALKQADEVLRGPIGVATLDPQDLNYRPYYNNSEDSADFATSKGRNYHQGPEWVWPLGFLLRAMLKFEWMTATTSEQKAVVLQRILSRLKACRETIRESPWAGLPELTNKDGSTCGDSSPTQAWSSSCLLDLFYDIKNLT